MARIPSDSWDWIFQQLALGDSSIRALSKAEPVVGSFATRFQIDLLDLPWRQKWDVIFLLDVLEHIPSHITALQQIYYSLKPGGLLFITVPALQFFWTYNDDLAKHQRRYSEHDFLALAESTEFELVRTDYFMFFLSPALFLHRVMFSPKKLATAEELQAHLERSHRIPNPIVNKALETTFSLEAYLVNKIKFPWGSSILAVFRR